MHMLRYLKVLPLIKRINSIGFDRVEHTWKGLKFFTYRKDAVKTLRKQVLLSAISRIIAKPDDTETKLISHPISTKVGRLIYRAAEMFVKNRDQEEVTWCTSREQGEQSIVGAAQMFSENFVTTLKANV